MQEVLSASEHLGVCRRDEFRARRRAAPYPSDTKFVRSLLVQGIVTMFCIELHGGGCHCRPLSRSL